MTASSIPGKPKPKVELPGSDTFVELEDGTVLPPGTVVDLTGGAAISLVDSEGNTMAFFAEADDVPSMFVIGEAGTASRVSSSRAGPGAGPPITEIRLSGGDFSACKKRTTALAEKKRKPVRRLWGKGQGRFRTKGRLAAATVRSTWWETADFCDGTLVRVRQGVVEVTDLVRKKTRLVRSGQAYFAKAPAPKKPKKPKKR